MSILIRPPEKNAEYAFVKLLAREVRDPFMIDLFEAFQYPEMRKGKGKKDDEEKAQSPDKDFPLEFYQVLSLAVGKKIAFPRKSTVDSLIQKAEIYLYLKENGLSADAFRDVMKRYKLSRGDADRIYRDVKSCVE